MSEVTNQTGNQAVTTYTPDQLKKMELWGKTGLAVSELEMQLQARAQASIKKLITPKTIEEIPAAEAMLKEVGKEYTAIQNDRKLTTSKLEAVCSKLMNSEKLIESAIPGVKQAIIAMKQLDAENKRKQQEKTDELRRIREKITNYITQKDAEYKQKIADQVQKAYAYALGEGNKSEADIPEFIKQCQAKKGFDEYGFTYDILPITPVYATKEEVLAIWNELAVSIRLGNDYVADYHASLDSRFKLYSVALKNKEAAINLANENAKQAAADLAKETEAKETAAKLDAIAVTHATVVSGPEIKALKSVYKVDMEDTDQNAIKIIAAFVGNFELCRPGVRVTSLMNLSVTQMASALAWVKNKDENFECGIVFKAVDKL